ncbi:MAG TPA: hypothetical protein DDW50_20655 [Firmicutes bacterium]|jgi:N-acyl homoserine lactone hydrolase|nr:hypothetical protein [Bacillota bacterium]
MGGSNMNGIVHLLDYGYNMADYSIFIAGANQGQRVKIPVMGCYIDHPEAKIVVDTGVSDPKAPGAVDCQHVHTEKQTPLEQLKKLGVKPEEIKYLVITHLHYDHAGAMNLFPNAKVIVRREELKEAYVPMAKDDINYYRPDFDRKDVNYDLIPNGLDIELADGITVLSVPGHTVGTQCVVIKTSEGPVIYAADSVYWYKNWEENKLPGILYSAEKFDMSIAKMKAIRGGILIPGHEPTLDLNRVYGK